MQQSYHSFQLRYKWQPRCGLQQSQIGTTMLTQVVQACAHAPEIAAQNDKSSALRSSYHSRHNPGLHITWLRHAVCCTCTAASSLERTDRPGKTSRQLCSIIRTANQTLENSCMMQQLQIKGRNFAGNGAKLRLSQQYNFCADATAWRWGVQSRVLPAAKVLCTLHSVGQTSACGKQNGTTPSPPA